jgi:hypothetical protein
MCEKTVKKYCWLWPVASLPGGVNKGAGQQIRLVDLDGDSMQKSPQNQEINKKKAIYMYVQSTIHIYTLI